MTRTETPRRFWPAAAVATIGRCGGVLRFCGGLRFIESDGEINALDRSLGVSLFICDRGDDRRRSGFTLTEEDDDGQLSDFQKD